VLSISRETSSCGATQEFHNNFWIQKVHYRVHKSPNLLVSVLSQINQVRITQSHLSEINTVYNTVTEERYWALFYMPLHMFFYTICWISWYRLQIKWDYHKNPKVFTHRSLGLPSGLFPSGFPTNILYLIMGVCILLRVWDPGDWGFILSTQRYYRRLILLLNTTYTLTCFGRTTIFMQKYIIS
jgi:hypothetical protein